MNKIIDNNNDNRKKIMQKISMENILFLGRMDSAYVGNLQG